VVLVETADSLLYGKLVVNTGITYYWNELIAVEDLSIYSAL